jgi:hypothetical protein
LPICSFPRPALASGIVVRELVNYDERLGRRRATGLSLAAEGDYSVPTMVRVVGVEKETSADQRRCCARSAAIMRKSPIGSSPDLK